MNKLDKDYQELLQHIIDNGKPKGDRTGTGTLSVFDYKITHDMGTGFPLLTTKKMYWKGIVTELLWFLRGDTNIKWLVHNGCNIWNGDAFREYYNQSHSFKGDWPDDINSFKERIKSDDKFAKKWGELGPIYGHQWRSWKYEKCQRYDGKVLHDEEFKKIDQIQNAIDRLKTNPDSRRIMVSAWNVGELDQMTLPPCHWAFELYTEGLTLFERTTLFCTKTGQKDWKERVEATIDNMGEDYLNSEFKKFNIPKYRLHLKWHQRSVDTFLGLPFNIASYGLLLEILAKEVNMVPGTLVGDLTNVHLYNNHIEQAKEQINRTSFELPKLQIANNTTWGHGIDQMVGSVIIDDFQVTEYQSHETIKAPLSN
jgi:thymidylate synthase